MTTEIAIVFGLVVVALVLFALDRLPVDGVAMGIVVVLVVSGIIPVSEALAGFSNVATVTVAAMFVLSAGLRETGALTSVGKQLARLGARSEPLAIGTMMVVVAIVSGFINNTAAVAIFIPVVVDLAHRMEISPSRLLIPLSFASMFGGIGTLIGTSTNLLVDAIAKEEGFERFGMFEFTPLALALFAIGAVYLLLVQRRIPARRPADPEDLAERFDVGPYLARLRIEDGAAAAGTALGEDALMRDFDLEVVDVLRGDRFEPRAHDWFRLRSGDVVRVLGTAEALLAAAADKGLSIVHGGSPAPTDAELETGEETLVEAVIAPESTLGGRRVGSVGFDVRHGAQPLGLRKAGALREDVPVQTLRPGDTLLLLVARERLPNLRADTDFIVVSELATPSRRRRHKLPLALAVVAAVVVAATTGLLPIVAAAVAGALAMVAVGALTSEEAYAAINWRIIFLLAGVIPLGTALEMTGGAMLVADVVVAMLEPLGAIAVLGGVFLVTQLTTSVISNNASAVLFAPIAIGAAQELGADPRPFLIAVTIAASMSFVTPVGYQTNTMIYGPGQYRFSDFIRIGGPLSLLVLVAATLLIPVLWEL